MERLLTQNDMLVIWATLLLALMVLLRFPLEIPRYHSVDSILYLEELLWCMPIRMTLEEVDMNSARQQGMLVREWDVESSGCNHLFNLYNLCNRRKKHTAISFHFICAPQMK
uniref:Uncharacterized protein n=1 Tax=Opuntia streptacantha TaxID=393608 RepID=A0A7C8Z4M6_OPUST